MQGLSNRRKRLPRRAGRLLNYLAVAVVVYLLTSWRHTSSSLPARALRKPDTPQHSARNSSRTAVDFAWGSLLHRFQNHPRAAPQRVTLPWKEPGAPTPPRQLTTQILIVTSELSGLHKNGGIGTAYHQLSTTLGESISNNVSILVAHPAKLFPVRQRQRLEDNLLEQGVNLFFVDENRQPIFPQAWTPVASSRVWEWMRAHGESFDIIHFPDNTGIGYFSALAKHQGLALQHAKLVVGLHGPDVEWAAILNKRYPHDRYSVELGEFEQRTAELADVVVAPSEYILEYVRSRGWRTPLHAFVIPNIVKEEFATNRHASQLDIVQPITELVFFGRFEERKGTRLLIAALELLYGKNTSDVLPTVDKITFLGRDVSDVASRSDTSALIEQALLAIKRLTMADFEISFIKKADRQEALTYLQDPSRLAILPALADNSPSTVLECAMHSVRFITSSVGGIPELLHPEDADHVLFAPLVQQLANKIVSVTTQLSSAPWKKIRPRSETQTAAADWHSLHRWLPSLPSPPLVHHAKPLVSICITHYERPRLIGQLMHSLVSQTYKNIQIVLVDDGSTSPEAKHKLDEIERDYFNGVNQSWRMRRIHNSYLGEARNRAAELASGDWLLFMDDDDVLKPHALETLVSVAAHTNASALSTWLDEFASDRNPLQEAVLPHRRTYWFLGQSIATGVMYNCFGSGNIFVTRTAFDAVGGFSTYREVGAEDWEFWMRLALGGWHQLTVTEELVYVRSDPSRYSMKFAMDPWEASYHALVPLLNDGRVSDLGLAHTLMVAKSTLTRVETVPPLADSQDDFELMQDWAGWSYYFESTAGKPSLSTERQAVLHNGQWMFERDDSSGFIADSFQLPHVTAFGDRYAATRVYRSPREAEVAIELVCHAQHQCGDGTEVVLMSRKSVGSEWVVHARLKTMDDPTPEYRVELSLDRGSHIVVWTDPLENADCDTIELKITLYPVVGESIAWSNLARRAEIEATAQRKAAQEQLDREREGDIPNWEPVEQDDGNDGDEEAEVFHIALIFDHRRFEHFKQVIRSANHFVTSRILEVHAIAPLELHADLNTFFADLEHTLRLYDHAMCRDAANRVLAFSNEDIHISAHCKMFLTEIISEDVDTVLYLDTDTTIVSDISACYAHATSPTALISMALDMGDACQDQPDYCWPIGLHWRVTDGLECGNLPGKSSTVGKQSCAKPGELEPLQVNGGVALMQLRRMRSSGFVDRYVQSVVYHYRLAGRVAEWGEQDFINSYLRLYPSELELLPCGCNYQWFGSRSEVKCGGQPIAIAHHWAHGIVGLNDKPFNKLFHYFLDSDRAISGDVIPSFPSTVPSTSPLIPNTTRFAVENTLNCPRQTYDCSSNIKRQGQYGQPVKILSRIVSEVFASDLVRTIDAQTYPAVEHFVAARPSIQLPPSNVVRRLANLNADIEGEYAQLCDACGNLGEVGAACTTPPSDPSDRVVYFECACSAPDSTYTALYDLDSMAGEDEGGWVLYMDDNKVFVDRFSLALLMAEADDETQLLMFRSNTTTNEADFDYRRKVLSPSEMEGVGLLFHTSALDVMDWDGTRCGRWAAFSQLSSRLRIKWLDIVPTMTHPLHHHLPHLGAEDFKLTAIVFESRSRPTWSNSAVDALVGDGFKTLVKEVIVLSFDTQAGAYDDAVRVISPTPGSGLAQISKLVKTEGVLLLHDDVTLDKTALTSLLNYWLDDPLRLVGFFTETVEHAFSPRLTTDEDDYDHIDEVDPIVGVANYTHLLPRTLLAHKSIFDSLTDTLSSSRPGATALNPKCHPLLLSALAGKVNDGQPPSRVLPPPRSIVDRVHGCRVRQYARVGFDPLPGDAVESTPSSSPEHQRQKRDRGDESDDGYDGDAVASAAEEEDELDLNTVELGPTLQECIAAIDVLLGGTGQEDEPQWLHYGNEVGVAGAHGVKLGVEEGGVSDERWQAIRREDECFFE